MDKNTKQAFVENYGEKLARARMAVVADYKGIAVNDLTMFRKTLAGTPGRKGSTTTQRLAAASRS